MTRNYVSYGISILAGLLTYFMFAVMSSVAAGITWIPTISFLGSILHVGLGSWLFLVLPKPEKITSIITTILMCIWPFAACIYYLKYFDASALLISSLPILISGIVVWNHVKGFQNKIKPSVKTQIILSAVPLAFLIYMVYFYVNTFTWRWSRRG